MRVRARPFGWDAKDGDAGPSLEGVPAWVEGELTTSHVSAGLLGAHFEYDRHVVDGVDVDPKTIVDIGPPGHTGSPP